MCWYVQQSVTDTVRQWPGVWQEVESAINISSQKLGYFPKSLHFVKGSLGKTQKTQHLGCGWVPHQYFFIMEVSLIVIFWYETCVLDFSKVDLFCLLCYLSKVLSTPSSSVINEYNVLWFFQKRICLPSRLGSVLQQQERCATVGMIHESQSPTSTW